MLVANYQHISFDLDGTLVHTLPEYRYRIVPQVVNQLGGSILEQRSIDKFWFETGRDNIIRQEFNLDPKLFWQLFREIDSIEDRSQHTHPYPDTFNILKRLKTLNKTVSIITGSPSWIAEMEINKLNDDSYDYYLSMGETQLSEKPDPQGFHIVLQKLNHQPHETLYIGNSNEDALFAKNCGADFIYLERNEYKFDQQDWVTQTIHSLEELF